MGYFLSISGINVVYEIRYNKKKNHTPKGVYTTMTVRKLTIPLSKEQKERIEYLSIQYKEEEIITLIERSLSPLLDTVLSIMDAVIEENKKGT